MENMWDPKEKMVKDYQLPESGYAERFQQAPLDYVRRQDRMMEGEAKQLRNENYVGRYDK